MTPEIVKEVLTEIHLSSREISFNLPIFLAILIVWLYTSEIPLHLLSFAGIFTDEDSMEYQMAITVHCSFVIPCSLKSMQDMQGVK